MKTQTFLQHLAQNSEKELQFAYATGKYVPNQFHITEIKNVLIESVDCGGNPDTYRQTVVQLWDGNGPDQPNSMTAKKAFDIFQIVERKKPIAQDAEIYFEYGNDTLRTSTYAVQHISLDGKIVVDLAADAPVCKPSLVAEDACCEPASGCC